MDKNEFKKMVFQYVIDCIMKIYKLDKDTSEKIVNNYGFDVAIDVAPEMIAHCSQEQLIDMEMNIRLIWY